MAVVDTEDEHNLCQKRSNPLSWRSPTTPSTRARENLLPNSPNLASYIQRRVEKEAYLVAQTIRTGVLQTIDIPPPVPANDPNAADLATIRVEVVRAVAKRCITLNKYLNKGFDTVYDQCS